MCERSDGAPYQMREKVCSEENQDLIYDYEVCGRDADRII